MRKREKLPHRPLFLTDLAVSSATGREFPAGGC